MTTTEDLPQDVGPLERSHLKDMVHRNAIEDAAYGRVAKHLETQRKAFVRQNTRDEEEMRQLLCRLQSEQQTSNLEDEDFEFDVADNISENETEEEEEMKHEETANPYPVTILPKYPAGTQQKKTGSRRPINIPESPRMGSRRKSIEYEDIQESLSAMTLSKMSPSVNSSHASQSGSAISLPRDETIGDWLATPDAISSVRRLRKTVSEQANRKTLIRTNSELLSQHDLSNISSLPSTPRVRSNSFIDRNKQTTGKDDVRYNGRNRRGGSMKERKQTVADDSTETRHKPVARSYSQLTRAALAEFNLKQEVKTAKHKAEIQRETDGSENLQLRRSNSKKSGKQVLVRKSSNETDEGNANRKVGGFNKKLLQNGGYSPTRSPLAADEKKFKF